VREKGIGNGLEGIILFLVEILFSNMLGEAERNHENTAVGMDGIPAEMQIRYFLKTNQKI